MTALNTAETYLPADTPDSSTLKSNAVPPPTPKRNAGCAAHFRVWMQRNPEAAREAFRRAGLKTSHQPGHAERLRAAKQKWADENPEAAHRESVRAGFATAHFARRCHEAKANPRCPFCYPDGTEAKV
jgi:hypothetical protein